MGRTVAVAKWRSVRWSSRCANCWATSRPRRASSCRRASEVTPLLPTFQPARPASSSGTAADAPVGFAPDLARRAQVLVAELRRRHVFKVAGGYLVAAWIVLQVAETTFDRLHLPGWWLTALTIVAVIGLPIVTALAWSYEITSGGIVADTSGGRHVTLSRPRPRRSLAPWLVGGVR